MGFICGTSMLPKSDDKHIVCLVACEVATYSTSIDDIAIKGFFLLSQLIAPFPIRKHNLMWIYNHPYCQPNLHHNKHTFVCFYKQYHNPQ